MLERIKDYMCKLRYLKEVSWYNRHMLFRI